MTNTSLISKVEMAEVSLLLVIFTLVCLTLPSNGTKPSLSDPLNLQRWGGKLEVLSDDYVKGSVWPKPQGQSPTGVKFSLLPRSFLFTINGKTSDVLTNAVKRYTNLTFPDFGVTKKDDALTQMTSLEIVVVDDYRPLSLESDESCKFAKLHVCEYFYCYCTSVIKFLFRGLELGTVYIKLVLVRRLHGVYF
jgi:hypothetical protein